MKSTFSILFYLKRNGQKANGSMPVMGRITVNGQAVQFSAKSNGWIYTDPFANYKIRIARVDRGYLTQEQLDVIIGKKFALKRLELVRDIFVFSCYTGLAYIDVKNLRQKHIRTSFDGNLWVMTKRQKTDVQSNIPLLDVAKQILEKYKGTLSDEKVLPILSNQKMNAYLKEIGDLCGIEQNLTFHLARHTFGTTVTLSKGVPIETVSKMLGHTNIKTTQIYARITNSKIGNDMAVLAGKLKEAKVKKQTPPKSKIDIQKEQQKSMMQKSGELISDILSDDFQTIGTETTVEFNFSVLKVKHTVKRKPKGESQET